MQFNGMSHCTNKKEVKKSVMVQVSGMWQADRQTGGRDFIKMEDNINKNISGYDVRRKET
jgi:hypothetical protein